MSSLSKGVGKVEVRLRWDPAPRGSAAVDLDLVAATYPAADPHGTPAYLVHSERRAPDGVIILSRESRTGQGLGYDEIMTLELDRLSESYGRVVVGVIVQPGGGAETFGEVGGTGVAVVRGYDTLFTDDLSGLPGATAATVVEFTRAPGGGWRQRAALRGFDTDPTGFAAVMGSAIA